MRNAVEVPGRAAAGRKADDTAAGAATGTSADTASDTATERTSVDGAPTRGPVARFLRSGWLPTAAVVAITVPILMLYETPARDIATYALYVIYGLVVPGTLLWRALRGTTRSFAEDVAGGTALAYAVELFVYLPARALGMPLAVRVWPAVVIVAFIAIPSLRKHWRASGAERAPAWFSWTIAAVVAAVFACSTSMYFRWHGLNWPWSTSPYYDTLYQLALASDAKNHGWPQTPYLLGASLDYHWFVHAHMAASSWFTGIELQTILYRLFALPMLAALAVLVALCAKRLSGHWWTGAVAAAMTFLGSALSPYPWSGGAYFDLALLESNLWTSPTQTFAGVLFAALLLLLIGRLRGDPGGRGEWVMIVLLLAAVMGAKATFLPLLMAGLGLVLVVEWWVHRTINRVAAAALAATIAFFIFASTVIFHGGSHALQVRPLQTILWMGAMIQTGLSTGYATKPPYWLTFFIAALVAVSWGARTAGVAGLLARRKRTVDPAVLLLGGLCLAGLGLTMALRHPGISQTYFLRSVAPYLAVLSVCGLAALIPAARANRRIAAAVAAAAAFGGAIVWAVTALDDPLPPTGSRPHVALELLKPFVAVGLALAVGTIALLAARRRTPALRGITAALVVAAVIGTGLPPSVDRFVGVGNTLAEAWRVVPTPQPGERPIAEGGQEAARWLRAHSDPSDIIATNTHCRRLYLDKCDNRHFWIAGFTERRVLVEGWGYTPETFNESWTGKGPFFHLPYWDAKRLRDNDAAFIEPSSQTLGVLRDTYGVKYLFVDERYDTPSGNLDWVAKLRYERGDVKIYEVPASR